MSDGFGIELHADVLLLEHLPEGTRVPVILSVGAYVGHSGNSLMRTGRAPARPTRFYSQVEDGAWATVDLRGFGDSPAALRVTIGNL